MIKGNSLIKDRKDENMTLTEKITTQSATIGVIGLGYVGLPLAVEFGKKFSTLGFDIDQERIEELKRGHDRTLECTIEHLASSPQLEYANNLEALACCDIYIVTVPTPIDENKTPDLRPLIAASKTVAKVLETGNLVIYESTVYPGCTEEDCVPVLEQESGLKFNRDFFCGYSPERINPGDKEHTITKILKVTSGSTPKVGQVVDALYRAVITAGTHLAPSIKVAEAAKAIENSQRDINIAFVNELSMIFHRMGIDTNAVLEAAETKWNFLPFKPGLVGGHCIGVDPYYLTQKAIQYGYHPEIILAGRRLNDKMGKEVAERVVKLMIHNGHCINGSRVLVLGITFKENCPDIRNTRAIDVYNELRSYNINVDVYDPWANSLEVKNEFGFELINEFKNKYHAIILTVSHKEFLSEELHLHLVDGGVFFDVKGILDINSIDARL